MNKKTYLAPSMKVMDMEVTSIIATSGQSLIENGSKVNGDVSLFDDDGDAWNEGV